MAISLSDIIKQNTLGQSEGFPAGVPTSYDWYKGWAGYGMETPPATFTAVEGWGQVYQQAGQPAISNPSAFVHVANAKTYVHIKETNQWVLVQDQAQTPIAGGHFVTDFAGNGGYAMNVTSLAGGGNAFVAPPNGYNDHFWYRSRGTFAAGTVDGVYVQMDMRVTDPNLNLVASIGADWWRNASAPYLQDHSNNPAVGSNNWVELSSQWRTVGYYSMSTAEFQADLPPPLRGVVQTPPVTGTPDTVAPAAPRIVAFTPDTGTVGDRITTASVLTLSGTAEAGSTVKLFDGATQIGTARASASGAWSLATAQLPSGAHNFTARTTDAAGNTSTASAALSLRVDAVSAPPVTPPVTGANLLVNGSFETSPVASSTWAGFNSIPGWTAISGGTIELWNNLNGVRATNGSNFGELDYLSGVDGLYQTVKTVAGQNYNLSFDARSRPGFTSSTTTIEVLWNDQVVASVAPGSAWNWNTYRFSVTGTGGQDRLTFREAAGQSADGLGALYDNVSLVPASTAVQQTSSTIQQSAIVDPTQAMNLMTQYSATSFPNSSFSPIAGLQNTDTSSALAQVLGAKVS